MSTPRLPDRVLLGAMGLLPARLARRMLFLLSKYPTLADRWGYHVRRIHYYEPIPDFRTLTREQLKRRRLPAGVVFDIDEQARRIEDLAQRFADELRAIAERNAFPFDNEYFAGYDAAVYYALIRDLKPRRVMEIGGGYSTRIAALALQANEREGHAGTLTVIEPHPEPRLTQSGIAMTLIVEPVERVDAAIFAALAANDILFIDSSHAVRTGGDVVYEFLDLLPTLATGTWIHVHDIFFPFDYPAEWVIERRLALNEQYLLHAFLAYNHEFTPMLCNYWLGRERAASMRKLIDAKYRAKVPAYGASFWMVRR